MNNIKKLLFGTLSALLLVSIYVTPVFADGTSYSPYNPHIPVPTGLGNIEAIALVGAVLYVGGVSLVTLSQVIKSKFIK